MAQTGQTTLLLGTPYNGTLAGSGQAELFDVNVPSAQVLSIHLTDAATTDQNELYAQLGSPPTRSSYQYRFSNLAAANQDLLIPLADAGTWYILLYANYVPTPSTYELTTTGVPLLLTDSTPLQYGNIHDTQLTLTGAGFDNTTTVQLVDADGTTTYEAAQVQFHSATQLTATFTSSSVPPGPYSVQVKKGSATDTLSNAFTLIDGGLPHLVTQVIAPDPMGLHISSTLYLEYSNTGDAAMPAPLLTLTAYMNNEQGALLTLDQSLQTSGFWTSSTPFGYSQAVQILASGATPGVLQPGESIRVPIYYAGWLRSQWDLTTRPPINFTLKILQADDTTPIDWTSMQETLRPASINQQAWDAFYPELTNAIGTTWGDYVSSLDLAASALAATGQATVDAQSLWNYEIQQANGAGPVAALAATTDVNVTTTGMSLAVDRSFPATISGRNQLGPFGMGWQWSQGWERTLILQTDGTVFINDADGSVLVFQPDSRSSGKYFAAQGTGTLTTLAGGGFSLDEDGQITGFDADGTVSFLQDADGHQITADYTNGLLTRLTASPTEWLTIAYNTAGLITTITDEAGGKTICSYDATNTYLLSVTTSTGQTTTYSYDRGSNAASKNALLSVQYASGEQLIYTYTDAGLLSDARRGFAVTGRVVDAGGNPIANALITLSSRTIPGVQFTGASQPDGTYLIAAVAQDTYDVVVLCDGFLTGVQTDLTVASATSAGQTALATSSTQLTGTVTDSAGNPIAGAAITVSDSNGHVLGQATSAADGTFLMTTASGSNLTLRIKVPGVATDKTETISVTSGTTVALGAIDPDTSASNTSTSGARSFVNSLLGSGWLSQLLNLTLEHDPNEVDENQIDFPACPDCLTAYADARIAADNEQKLWETAQLTWQGLHYATELEALKITEGVAYGVLICDAAVVAVEFAVPLMEAAESALEFLTPTDELAREELEKVIHMIGLLDAVNTLGQAMKQHMDAVTGADSAEQAQGVAGALITEGADDLDTLSALEEVAADILGSDLSEIGFVGGLVAKAIGAVGVAVGKLETFVSSELTDIDNAVTTVADWKQRFDTAYANYEDGVANALAAYDAYLTCLLDCGPPIKGGNGGGTGGDNGDNGGNGGSDSGGEGPGGDGNGPGSDGGGDSEPTITEGDPNAMYGPGGFGAANDVAARTALPYQITFENDPNATAPAQCVTITDQLSTDLDWSTFAITGVGFGDTMMSVPSHSQFYQSDPAHPITMTYNGETFDIDVEIGINPANGQVYASFQSIDPATSLPPSNPLTGFLPPEDGTGRGMGYFSFTVQPRATLATGTQIRNVALVQFDRDEIIATDQVDEHDPSKGVDPTKQALVTIDGGAPSSSVNPLPTTSMSSFTVSWTGQDDVGGSGVRFYDVYVSTDDGKTWSQWQSHTSATAADYSGQIGQSYAFYSVATDNVGNVQPTPMAPQASTLVPIATQLVVTTQPPSDVTAGADFAVTIKAEDASGNVDLGFTSAVTLNVASNPGGGTLGGTLTVNAVNGVATFSGLTLNKVGSGYTLQAASAGLPVVVTNAIAVIAATATQLVVTSQPPANVTVGAGIGMVVAAEDSFGNVDPTFNGKVAVALANHPVGGKLAGTLTATASNGVAVLTGLTLNKLGTGFTMKVTSPSLSTATTTGINVVTSLDKGRVVHGSGQSATVGTSCSGALQVTVTGSTGKPAANVPVSFILLAAGPGGTFQVPGAPTQVVVNTNAAGLATAPTLVANTITGTYRVSIALQGIVIPAVFSETNKAGIPASIAVLSGANQSATVGKTFPHPMQVIVKDAFGNLVTGAAVTFTAPANGASGRFSVSGSPAHVTVKTNAAGLATAPAFVANKVAGSYTVTASVAGFGTLASFTETNHPGAAASIAAVAGSKQITTVDTPFTEPLQAIVTDAFGNAVANVSVTFAAPTNGAGGVFQISGSPTTVTAITNTDGVATAPILIANNVVASFFVTASAKGVKKTVRFVETNAI